MSGRIAHVAHIAILFAAVGLAAVGCISVNFGGAGPGGELSNTTVDSGAKLYASNCATCHGDAGERVPVSPLNSATFLDSRGDATLVAVISQGKGVMPAWGKARGGPLTDDQIRAVVAYLSKGAGRTSPTLLADAGRAIYADQCVTCHGDAGDRVPVAPLNAKPFLDTRSDAQLADVIARGTGVMPAFGVRPGVAAGLSNEQVHAVAAYLRTKVDADVAARVDRGRTLYVNNCLSCHGEKGDRIPNVTLTSAEYLRKEGDATLAQVVLDGKGAMPGLTRTRTSSFDVEDVGALLAYLKTWAGLPAGLGLTGNPTPVVQPAGTPSTMAASTSGAAAPALAPLPTTAPPVSAAASANPAAPLVITTPALTAAPLSPSEQALVNHGKDLFSQNCTICHGESKEQIGKLANGTWLVQTGDRAVTQTILQGKMVPGAGLAMPAFGKDKQGPLSDDDAAAIVGYLKSMAGISLTASTSAQAGPDVAHGKDIFSSTCAACHGARGDQLPTAKLNDASFLQQRGPQELTQAITAGKGGMPAFGARLSPDDVAAVVAFLQTQAGIAPPPSSGVGANAGQPAAVVPAPISGAGAGGGGPPDAALVAKGKDVFGTNCATCHGARGDQLPTARLNDPAFLQQQGDQTLVQVITNGRGGMPAWGGKLSGDDIAAALGYIKSLAGLSGGGGPTTAAPPPVTPPPDPSASDPTQPLVEVNPEVGHELFINNCSMCHGEDGQRIAGIKLLAPDWSGPMSGKSLYTRISKGAASAGMPTWSKALGGPLSNTQIAAIVAYIKDTAGGPP